MDKFEFLTVSVSATAGFSVLAWMTRSIIRHWLSKDVESHKIKLKYDADTELEHLRNEFQLFSLEHKIKFDSLHAKRIEVIGMLHATLWDIFDTVKNTVSLHQGPDFREKRVENAKILDRLTTEFLRNFNKQRLYLNKELCDQLSHFITELWNFNLQFSIEMNLASRPMQSGKFGNELEIWLKASNAFDKKFPPVLDSLETEFRRLIGVKV